MLIRIIKAGLDMEAKIASNVGVQQALKYIFITIVGYIIFLIPGYFFPEYLGYITTLNITILIVVTTQFYLSIIFGMFERKKLEAPEVWPMVSILIPAYNEEQVLARTMSSMMEIDYPEDRIEFVYVYEQKSTDDTESVILKYAKKDHRFKPIKRNETHGGKAAAANYGIRRSNGEIIGSFDADHSLAPDSVRKAVLRLQDDNIVCIKGRCRTINKGEGFLSLLGGVERDIAESLIIPQHDIIGGFSFFGGGHAFFKKSIFEEIGYFDEKIMCEDIDYSLKIHKAGYNIRVDPSIISWEESPASFSQWWHQRKRWSRGWIQCARVHIGSIMGHPKFSFIKKIDTIYYLLITLLLPVTIFLYPTSILSYLGIAQSTFYPTWVSNLLGVYVSLGSFLAVLFVLIKDYRAGEKIRWKEIPAILMLIFYMPAVLFVSWVGWVDEFILSSENEYVKTLRSGAKSV